MPDSRRRRNAKAARKKSRPKTRRQHSDEPPLLGEVRRALDDGDPLGLLTYVSMLMYITDPRRRHPFADPEEPEPMRREELIGSFIDVPAQETSALLAGFEAMIGDDDLLRARVRRELAVRPKLEWSWLGTLSKLEVYRAVLMSHILGDSDDIMLGARLADGHEITCVVYIDHNVGTLVKDAFVLSVPLADVVARSQEVTDDPDTHWEEMSLADAKTRIASAIGLAAITVPPFESETWPACRALVEWVIRGLPDGGTEYERQHWDSEDTADLCDRFFSSEEGARLDDRDHRDLLESLLWYGTDYGSGDPMRWSTVKVELLLIDWLPRKVVAPVPYLALAPDLLRAFVRFAHREVGVRPGLTSEALTAIDEWEPEYQKIIRSPRLQGPAALLAAMGIGDENPELDFDEIVLHGLSVEVGGRDQLDQLDDRPLPDEPFRWSGIADDITDRVREVLGLTDRCCDDSFDLELRTACRRLLARAAAGDAEVFRRKGKADTAAAAIVWIIGKVNNVFSQRPGGMQVKDLMGYFGVKGSASQRAGALLRAGGFDCGTSDIYLGSPDYLSSTTRWRIIELRDRQQTAEDDR